MTDDFDYDPYDPCKKKKKHDKNAAILTKIKISTVIHGLQEKFSGKLKIKFQA